MNQRNLFHERDESDLSELGCFCEGPCACGTSPLPGKMIAAYLGSDDCLFCGTPVNSEGRCTRRKCSANHY